MMTLAVDVYAWLDIACPWCWIAKRRFGLAVQDYRGPVRIDYRSFELAPHLPDDYLSASPTSCSRPIPAIPPSRLAK
jgi:predicted DsbA family dithiol-disulfide isomerase